VHSAARRSQMCIRDSGARITIPINIQKVSTI
jgi:hypothetical protein